MSLTLFRPRHILRFPAALAALAAAGLALSACRLGVNDAYDRPDPVPKADRVLEEMRELWVDTSAEAREMRAAATRPKAVIRWLDNDSAWTGRYRGMVLDMDTIGQEYVIKFRHPENFFSNESKWNPRYKFGFMAFANDGDGDGRIFNWDRHGNSPAERIGPPDSVADKYRSFQAKVEAADACGARECKKAGAEELEALSRKLEAEAEEIGYRAAQRKGTPSDWYMAENGRTLVIWIPDTVALGQLSQVMDRNCIDAVTGLQVGYNFKRIDKPFPRMKETTSWSSPAPEGEDTFIFWAGVENLEDRRITFSCSGDSWSSFRYTQRIFTSPPPEFQNGPNDIPWW